MSKPRIFGPDTLFDSGLEKLISEIESDRKGLTPSGEDFTELILKDEAGKPVKNHRVHKEFHWFIQEAIDAGHNRAMIVGAFLLGKCFVEGESIDIVRKRKSGTLWSSSYRSVEFVPVEDVEAGDYVLTVNKKLSPVWIKLEKSAFFSGRRHSFEIKFHGGKTQQVSHNHPFLVYGNKWKKAIDLEIGDYVKLCSYANVGSVIPYDPNEAWYIGLYLGDGSYGKFTCGDDLVIQNLERLGSVSHTCSEYGYILLGSGKLLRKYDIYDREAKSFPACVFSFGDRALAHFIAGYFDADGSIYINDDSGFSVIELYSVKKLWLDYIQNLLLRFGIFSTVRKKVGKYKGEDHISWRLSIYRKGDLERFKKYIPLKSKKKESLERVHCVKKINDGRDWNEDGWLYDIVKEVNYIGKQNTYGIEVPKTHIHVINGLISHNSDQIAIGYVLENIAKNPNTRIKVISNTDDFATDRVRAIRRYIDADDDFKQLCSHIKPTRIWGDSKFIVSRKAASKDATIEAFGLFGTAVGSRAELLLFDDPQDWRTAVTEPTTRERCKSVIENVWLPRLTEDGLAILLMNRWSCLHPDSDVFTSKGVINIRKVKKGQFVYGSTGLVRVEDVKINDHDGETIEIIPWYLSGASVRVTGNHPIYTKDGWKLAQDLTTDDYVTVPIYRTKANWQDIVARSFPSEYEYKRKRQKPVFGISFNDLKYYLDNGFRYKDIATKYNVSVGTVFNLIYYYGLNRKRHNDISADIIYDNEFWKILGYWIAEGHLDYGRDTNLNRVCFSFGISEKLYADEVVDFFRKYGLECNVRIEEWSRTVRVSSYQLSKFIDTNFKRYSYGKRLPNWFFSLPEDKFFNFLNGYHCGDGSLGTGKLDGRIRYTSVSKSLLIGLQLNLLRFGVMSSIPKPQGPTDSEINGKLIHSNYPKYELYIDSIEASEKKKYCEFHNDKVFIKVRKIVKEQYKGPVYDLTTSSGDFISPSFIVHNSDDIPGWIKNKREWAWLEIAVSKDLKKLEITRCIQGKQEKYSIPSWKPPEFYLRLKADMGDRNFARSCHLIPFSDSELYFPSFEKCVIWGHNPIEFGRNFLKNNDCLVVTGIDYSSSKRPGTILFTIAMDKKTEQRVPLDLVTLKDPAKLPEHVVRLWMEYGVNLFFAENNATQSVINDLLLNFAGYGNMPIEGFHTGKNKADPDMGVISLEKEFENKQWTFAFPNKPEPGTEKTNVWSRAYFEIRDYPFWEPNDIVMSLWFSREALNHLIRRKLKPVIY